jgi:hypothetical protein
MLDSIYWWLKYTFEGASDVGEVFFLYGKQLEKFLCRCVSEISGYHPTKPRLAPILTCDTFDVSISLKY